MNLVVQTSIRIWDFLPECGIISGRGELRRDGVDVGVLEYRYQCHHPVTEGMWIRKLRIKADSGK